MKTPRINKHDVKVWLKLNAIEPKSKMIESERILYDSLNKKHSFICQFLAYASDYEIENDCSCNLHIILCLLFCNLLIFLIFSFQHDVRDDVSCKAILSITVLNNHHDGLLILFLRKPRMVF